MNLTIKTTELQDMVSKASKCVSNNKLIPITSLMNIKVCNHKLTLTTTDAINYFYVSKLELVDCEDFEISVLADLFIKLVQKTTSDNITLEVIDGTLKVKGNGTYTMELPLDENGGIIKFPNKFPESSESKGIIKLTAVKSIVNYNKASLALNMEVPSLTCYYCGDSVVTSDRYKICKTGIKMFNEPRLITSNLMELLSILSKEDIEVYSGDNCLIFETDLESIYSPITDGIETFPIQAIEGLVEQEFTSSCKISKSAILNVLDRLSLFVSPYDKKGIYLTFTKDGLILSSKKSSGSELIPFISSTEFKDYTCCIDIEMLKTQISTQDTDELNLYYGSDIAIKLVDKNVTQIIALVEDDRVKEV